MYGAIIGDMIGSPYEFDRGDKTKDFPLFDYGARFTDDSVMTIAIWEGIREVGPDADEKTMKDAMIRSMKHWGRKHPNAGYGGKFYRWLMGEDTEPYNSFGNGSAMRVSSVGWLYDSLERTREVARWTAEVTHNHPEGVKGAESIASAMYMARTGCNKQEIKEYITREFGYDLDRTLDEIRPNYHMDATCQGSVSEAIIAFLEGTDYEDVIRGAISIGGDTDTLGAMAGAIGEAMYGVPEELKEQCRQRLDGSMNSALKSFEERV